MAAMPAAGAEWRSHDALHGLTFSIDAARTPAERIAKKYASLLPPDAIMVLPPETLRFTLLADRACVVSYKSNPHRVCYTEEWMRRIWECATGRSLPDVLPRFHRESLAAVYARMTTPGLQFLRQKYGATHALLPARSPAACDASTAALAADEGWRLIPIPDRPAALVDAHPSD